MRIMILSQVLGNQICVAVVVLQLDDKYLLLQLDALQNCFDFQYATEHVPVNKQNYSLLLYFESPQQYFRLEIFVVLGLQY